jgi:hypothetical protein
VNQKVQKDSGTILVLPLSKGLGLTSSPALCVSHASFDESRSTSLAVASWWSYQAKWYRRRTSCCYRLGLGELHCELLIVGARELFCKFMPPFFESGIPPGEKETASPGSVESFALRIAKHDAEDVASRSFQLV